MAAASDAAGGWSHSTAARTAVCSCPKGRRSGFGGRRRLRCSTPAAACGDGGLPREQWNPGSDRNPAAARRLPPRCCTPWTSCPCPPRCCSQMYFSICGHGRRTRKRCRRPKPPLIPRAPPGVPTRQTSLPVHMWSISPPRAASGRVGVTPSRRGIDAVLPPRWSPRLPHVLPQLQYHRLTT